MRLRPKDSEFSNTKACNNFEILNNSHVVKSPLGDFSYLPHLTALSPLKKKFFS